MRWWRLLLAALFLLLVAAVVVAWTLPAGVAWRWLGPQFPALCLQGVSGTVWHGRADRVSMAGEPLGHVQWQTDPWALLRGNLRLHTRIGGPLVQGTGTVVRHLDGVIVIHDADLSIPASLLGGVVQLPGVWLGGKLQLHVDQARVRNAWFVALKAHGRWHNLQVHGAAEANLGDLQLRFSEPSPPEVVARIRDVGSGPVQASGRLSATPTGFTLHARLRARDRNDIGTQEALGHLGSRQGDGSVVLRAEGQLLLPGLP